MDNSRREFFKKLGLVGLAAVATSLPIDVIGSTENKDVKSLLKQKIKVWYYYQCGDIESKYYMTEKESMIGEMIWKSGGSNPIEQIKFKLYNVRIKY